MINWERIASILSLDVAGAFDNVSHARLAHNLRKRKMPETLVRWVEDFLKDRHTEIRIADFTLEKSRVDAGIPQGSPVSPILYLFYNADLLEICENPALRTSPIGFADDVNLLTYGTGAEGNCRNLERVHNACEDWARRHGSRFNPEKYELLHLTRTPKRFNTEASIKIGIKEIRPAQDIRILGVRIDSALKWKAQLRAVEAHAMRMLSALQSITGSTWGYGTGASRLIYVSMIRPAMVYGASTWYTPESIKGARKGVVSKLKSLQGKCLRVVAGAYRATSTEALEIETHTQPIDIALEGKVARTMLRIGASQARHMVDKEIKKIRQQMRSKRGRQARVRKTLGQSKERWMHQIGKTKAYEKEDQEERPPWAAQDTPEQRRINAGYKRYIHDAQKAMKEEEDRKWKERWKRGTKGQHLRRIAEEPDGKNRTLHAGRAKAHSALLTQLRTGKIGFNEFLYERRVPGVWNKRCACGHATMSVRHVLLSCPQWEREREEELGDMARDLKEVLGTKHGATAAIRLILKSGLLEQFKATAQAKREERRRGAGEEQE